MGGGGKEGDDWGGEVVYKQVYECIKVKDSTLLQHNWCAYLLLLLHYTLLNIYLYLAYEPCVAKETHSYSCRTPALDLKLRFYLFLHLKVDSLILKYQSQAKKITLVLPSSKIKIYGKSVKELWVTWTDRQTDRQSDITLYIYNNIIAKYYIE